MKLKKWLLGLIAFAAMAVLCAVCTGAETYGDFEYRLQDDGTVEITDYTGSAKKVDIPEKIDGKSVTSIGVLAFSWHSDIESITIPNSVTSIYDYAFEGCIGLTSITIPNSVTIIGSDAFSDTALLKNQVTSVKYVGKWAVECDNDVSSVTIKNGTVGIASSTFEDCTSLKSVKIPNSVTEIGWSAFGGCRSLTSITIPDSVTSIYDRAFSYCESLTSIVIPDSVTYIGYSAFENCVSLTGIMIPDSVTYIGQEAFVDCPLIKEVTIPESVECIGMMAFGCYRYMEGCKNYDGFKINYTKNTYGHYYATLWGFSDERCLLTEETPNGLMLKNYAGKDKSFVIPTEINGKKVTSIGDYAFFDCPDLMSVTIPSSVTYIGKRAVAYMLGSTKVENFKIYCHSGTAGEQYAKDNEIDYELLPSKVTGVKLTGRAADALRINWAKNTSADGYIVEMYQGNKWVRAAKITNNSTTTFRKSGLKAGTAYKFRVKAYKMSGKTALYGNYSVTVAARTNPSVIKGAKLTGRAADALRINWTKNASADGYIVEMYKGNKWVRVAKITNNSTTTFRKAGLKASSVYKFRVRAYKMSGKTALYGNYSATVTARTNPSVVKGVKIAGKAKDALRVNWTKNTSAQGYIVEMYKGGKWVRVAKITNGNTTTFRKAGLAKNTTYKFRVRAYHMSGKTALYGNYGSVSGKTAAK